MAEITALPIRQRPGATPGVQADRVPNLESWNDLLRRLRAVVDERPVASVLVTLLLGYVVSRVTRRRSWGA